MTFDPRLGGEATESLNLDRLAAPHRLGLRDQPAARIRPSHVGRARLLPAELRPARRAARAARCARGGVGPLRARTTTRHFRGRFSAERRANLQAAEELLVGSRAKTAAGLGLFALSPLPSAQLFVAAGLLTVPLVPLTAAFFVGRLVSYSLYVAAASAAKDSLGDVLVDVIGSPWGIAFQVAVLAGLVLLLRVNWASLLESRRRRHEAQVGAVGAVQTTPEGDEGHRAGEQREPEQDDPVQEDRGGGDRRRRAEDDQGADQAAVDPPEPAR